MRDYAAEMKELQAKMEGRDVRLVITRLDFFAAVASPAWRPGVLGYADVALNGVTGDSDYKLRCFVCAEPWALDRPPCVMVLMEIGGTGIERGESMIAAICPHCIHNEDGFSAAVMRFFGGTHHVLECDTVGHA